MLLLTAGALWVAGCARPTAEPRPVLVHVSAERLARLHPQWANVADLDRQIAFLQRFAPEQVRAETPASLDAFVPDRTVEALDGAGLLQTIDSRLESVRRALEATDLRRLGQMHRRSLQEMNASLTQVRSDAERDAEARRLAIGIEYDDTIAKLRTQAEVVDSRRRQGLITQSTERAKEFDETLSAIAGDLRARARAEESAWIQDLMQLDLDIEAVVERNRQQKLAELEAVREQQREIMSDRLSRSLQEQRFVFYSTLVEMGALADSVPGLRPLPGKTAVISRVSIPSPELSAQIASLQKRRREQAAFVLNHTRAIVQSAAARRHEHVTFDKPSADLPERTESFRAAVQTGGRMLVADS